MKPSYGFRILIPDPDPQWFLRINGFARDTPWLHPVITGYADYGIVVFAALLLAGWWIARRRCDVTVLAAAVWAPLGALAAVAINQPIVAVFARAAALCRAAATSWCWPTAAAIRHSRLITRFAGAAAAGLWLVNRRLGTLAVLAAVAMAFARVYIGAHYTHDVLVGLGLGATVSGSDCG